MKVKFNALKGCFDLVSDSASDASSIKVTKACDASVAVGDIVYESLISDDTVVTNADNSVVAPSIGIVIAKPTTTTAEVLLYGEYDGASSLVKGEKVFLSVLGNFTSTPPATDYVQNLGFALSATKVFINPNYIRVKRV